MFQYRVLIIVPNETGPVERLQQYAVGVNCEFITTAERSQLFAGTLSIATLKTRYPAQADFIDAQAAVTDIKWALASTPTVAEFVVLSADLTAVLWGRTQGWLAGSGNDTWIRCNWEGVNNDELRYDECGDDITGMPVEGTDTLPIGDGFQLLLDAGYVPWVGSHGD
jgi:hypothetical protein